MIVTAEYADTGIRRPFYFKSVREAYIANPTWRLWREGNKKVLPIGRDEGYQYLKLI